MDKELKALLEQIIANQVVIYSMLREFAGSPKTTPKDWVVEEMAKKAEEFKSLL